jgi:hypothetical protein
MMTQNWPVDPSPVRADLVNYDPHIRPVERSDFFAKADGSHFSLDRLNVFEFSGVRHRVGGAARDEKMFGSVMVTSAPVSPPRQGVGHMTHVRICLRQNRTALRQCMSGAARRNPDLTTSPPTARRSRGCADARRFSVRIAYATSAHPDTIKRAITTKANCRSPPTRCPRVRRRGVKRADHGSQDQHSSTCRIRPSRSSANRRERSQKVTAAPEIFVGDLREASTRASVNSFTTAALDLLENNVR